MTSEIEKLAEATIKECFNEDSVYPTSYVVQCVLRFHLTRQHFEKLLESESWKRPSQDKIPDVDYLPKHGGIW